MLNKIKAGIVVQTISIVLECTKLLILCDVWSKKFKHTNTINHQTKSTILITMNNKFILNKYIPSELIDAVSEKSILATKDVFKTHLNSIDSKVELNYRHKDFQSNALPLSYLKNNFNFVL